MKVGHLLRSIDRIIVLDEGIFAMKSSVFNLASFVADEKGF
jgi:hypothetical protein